MFIFNRWAIQLISFYQKHKTVSGRCRHYPTCSHYGIACYQKFNFIKATCLTGFRILRCNPLSVKVYDPVPLTKKEKQEKEERLKTLLPLKQLLLSIHQQYPMSQIEDDLILLFENTFCKPTPLPPNQTLESIGFDTFRIYIPSSQEEPTYTFSDSSFLIDTSHLTIFFDKVDILLQMIKQKEIDYSLPFSKIKEKIYPYLKGNIPFTHSKIYRQHYSNQYIVVKQNLEESNNLK
ncbi:MAG: membrane protein insertion efficiency factor YidD [Prevotella sp.]|nr:membrane protein insertion efficiency factor YidD [Staphylococcus sp.]MCM1350590.1 membrane protein insertion efficiency factor YidD [Prevotella sp.]